MELLVHVLVRLARLQIVAPPDGDDENPTQHVIQVHQSIVEAILARDVELARHRMRRHLDALLRWGR